MQGGAVVKSYTIGHDVFLEAIAANQVRHLLKDGHGSTRQLVDATGNVISSGIAQVFAYDAYGNPHGFTLAQALTTHLYSGERTDQLTGLQYLRARYYNPATGTFNRLDPFVGNFSDPQSLHKYLYCHAGPIDNTDPTGMFTLGGLMVGIGIGISSLGFYNGAVLGAGYGLASAGGNLFAAHTNTIMAAVQGYFGSDMDKRGKVREYYPYAEIAKHVYGEGGALSGFVRLSAGQIPSSVPADVVEGLTLGLSSGFAAGLYRKGSQYVLAFRGTDDIIRDSVHANIPQGIGLPASQYSMAAKTIRALENAPPFSGNLTVTGHSLGGGLAAVASLVSNTRVPTITFNPAGPHPATLQSLGGNFDLCRGYQDITTFIVRNEFLNEVNQYFGVPDSVGPKIFLDPAPSFQGSFALHGMISMIAAMQRLL